MGTTNTTRGRRGGRLAAGVALLASLLVAGHAFAASIQGPRRSALEQLEEGDAIRHRLLLRGGRFEAAPTVGFTLNDAFKRNILFGAQFNYYFSDAVGIGVTGMYGTALDTGLAEEIAAKRAEKAENGSFSSVQLLASAELIYTPLIGKFALFGRAIVNYDVHLLVGAGGSSVTGSKDVEDFTPMAVAGLGLRTYVARGMALNIEARDYIFSSALNSVAESGEAGVETVANAEFSNNFAVTVGFGFFFPQEPTISD